MTRFQVITEKHGDKTIYLLRDLHTGALARIVPSLGANCLELKMPAGENGKIVPVIDDMKHLDKVEQQPSRYGIPILFPWPSGIPGGEFKFGNKVYQLNETGDTKSRHHGFVNRSSWRAARSDCDNTGAWLTCSIDSAAGAEPATRFPFQFSLEITFRLHPEGFQIDMAARNTGTGPMPMGMGLHPYFTIPFGEKGSRGECRLAGMFQRQWNLDAIVKHAPDDPKPQELFLSTPEFNAPADTGAPIGDEKFNHVYDARFGPQGTTSAAVIDPVNGVKLIVTTSRDFKTWVIFTPADRSVISIEPWTLAPNGFNLAAAGVTEAGMLTLPPGEVWNGQVAITVE